MTTRISAETRHGTWTHSWLLLALLASSLVSPSAFGQGKKPTIPKPEDVSLVTKDGVALSCTYYPGGFRMSSSGKEVTTVPGKEVVPVIMLHGWGGQRHEFDFAATYLQRLGHAVIVPDLRGHGESKTRRVAGRIMDINPERMRSPDLYAMVQDVEAVKKFLLRKNNEEKLNIDMLCLVGAEMGALVAANWAVMDWSRPQLPAFRQGKDVKAVVLLSPPKSIKGMTANKAFQSPLFRSILSVMIIVGKDDTKGYRDALTIFKTLERSRPELPKDPRERQRARSLFLVEPATSLSGTKLLAPRGLNVYKDIASFIYLRLVARKSSFPWRKRENPLREE